MVYWDFLPLHFRILYIILSILLIATFAIKNPYVRRWCRILVPPLYLVILFWIPFDLITTIFWGPAFVIAALSLCSILIKIIIAFVKKLRKRPFYLPLTVRLIRPLLVIGIVVSAFVSLKLSMKAADIYAVKTARQVQKTCQTLGRCPETIEGWDISEPNFYAGNIMYGKYGTKYPVRYIVYEDGTEFAIYVRHNIDESFDVTGGVDKELTASFGVCASVVEVDLNEFPPE